MSRALRLHDLLIALGIVGAIALIGSPSFARYLGRTSARPPVAAAAVAAALLKNDVRIGDRTVRAGAAVDVLGDGHIRTRGGLEAAVDPTALQDDATAAMALQLWRSSSPLPPSRRTVRAARAGRLHADGNLSRPFARITAGEDLMVLVATEKSALVAVPDGGGGTVFGYVATDLTRPARP
jgi:type II secretory pathway pseudopilin PulG